jgi:DNA-binding CsgD family transcriptional regulator
MKFTIDKKTKNIFDSLSGIVGCQDLNNVFLYINRESSETLGLKNPEDIVGRTTLDVPCEAAVNCAPIWYSQDKLVMEEKNTLEILDVHPYVTGWKSYVTRKSPLWNDEKTEVMGTIYHGLEITTNQFIKIFQILSKRIAKTDNEILTGENSRILTENIKKPLLTPRQTEVLFLLILGGNLKDIAKSLKISDRTVSVHIEFLKNKFDASNKSELIDNAYSLGVEKFIPKSLFNQQFSIILD